MLRSLSLFLLGGLLAAQAAAAQVPLVPSDRSGYRQKFDLQLPDAQFFFIPLTEASFGDGPFEFRFENPALNRVLESPSTVRYLTRREGGFHLQIFNLRAGSVPPDALGPQDYEILDADGEVVGQGKLLVTARLPEAVDLARTDGSRLFETGRAAPVALLIRTHENFAGGLRVVNTRDFELSEVSPGEAEDSSVLQLHATLRPLRSDAKELRLTAETADGRAAELVFPGLTVQAPAPRRVQVAGGPVFLDALGHGTAQVVLRGFPAGLAGTPELVSEKELVASEQEYDREKRELRAQVEILPRSARAPGTRELRELLVRAGSQLYRGFVEVVGGPVISAVRTDNVAGTAVVKVGSPTLVRVTGQNLDELRLDCSALGSDATCTSVGSGPTEIVAEVRLGAGVSEGEIVIPLAPTERRGRDAGQLLLAGGGARLRVERPALPALLTGNGLMRLRCGERSDCRLSRSSGSVRLHEAAAREVRLRVDESRIPVENGWQNLVVTVTRVRGDQRQLLRSFGSPGAPRTFRNGMPGGELPLIDASADLRHGDLILVRAEHVAEQYPVEYRNAAAVAEPYVARIYVDDGALKRLTADIGVQPVLLAWGEKQSKDEAGAAPGSAAPAKGLIPLYPNAGLGFTWQFLNERMEPRPFSAKLQILATNLKNVTSETASARPAIFLSGNLRIPGSDPNKPVLITGGLAHLFGEGPRWQFLLGAGLDLGVAQMIFGG